MHLAHDLRLALGRVSRRLRRLYVEVEGRPSFLELAVLQRLERKGPSSPGTLASDEGVTSAAVAASLASLEVRRLVVRARDTADGRRVVVTLTPAGRKTLKHRDDACVAAMDAALKAFSPPERDVLAASVPLLEKLAGAL